MGSTSDDQLLRALGVEELFPHFQPVINLKSGKVVGHEALLRGRNTAGEIESPATLFAAATALDLQMELERTARRTAIRRFAVERTSGSPILFLNFASWMLDERLLEPGLIGETCRTAGLDPQQVAIEIVEATVRDLDAIRQFAERNRDRGFSIALDDFGTEHSNLQRVPLVRPDVIKIDRSIIQGVADDVYQHSVLRSVVYLSRVAGALALAEGVERYEDLILCAREGVDLTQGFLVARPQPSVGQSHGAGSEALSELMPRLKQDLTAQLRLQIDYQSEIQNRIQHYVDRMSTSDDAAREAILLELLQSGDDIECAYLVRPDGVQLTETLFADNVTLREGRTFFSPAQPGDSHALKEYIYGLVTVGHNRFLTDSYVSIASGRTVRTLSTRLPSNSDGAILCVDLVAE